MSKNHLDTCSHELSDDDFTDEELALIYGTAVGTTVSCEDLYEENFIKETGAYSHE